MKLTIQEGQSVLDVFSAYKESLRSLGKILDDNGLRHCLADLPPGCEIILPNQGFQENAFSSKQGFLDTITTDFSAEDWESSEFQ